MVHYLKAFHVIFMVTWFSAIFYLPRLYVYHAMSFDQISLDRFKVMEQKLYHYILIPSSVLTIFFGAWLFYLNPIHYFQSLWMHTKLILVGFLLIYQFFLGYYREKFLLNQNTRSHVFYRIFNEIPSVLLIGIVILAMVKPF